MSHAFKIRDRVTGETFEAERLGRTRIISDIDPWESMRIEKGSVLIFDDERHPDWPESKLIANVYGPHEAAAFEERYEIIEGHPDPGDG